MTQKRLFLPITPYTRNAFLVQSETRESILHLVDLEGYGREKVVCTCEAFIQGGVRPCKHIVNVATIYG